MKSLDNYFAGGRSGKCWQYNPDFYIDGNVLSIYSISMFTDKDFEKLKADLIQNEVLTILSKHELRLDRQEKTVGGFPPL